MIYFLRRVLGGRAAPAGKDKRPAGVLERSLPSLLLFAALGAIVYLVYVGDAGKDLIKTMESVRTQLDQRFIHPSEPVQLRRGPGMESSGSDAAAAQLQSHLIHEETYEQRIEASEEEEREYEGCLRTIPEVDNGPHIVDPPAGPVTLVCCRTTVGLLNIAVHPTWAPIGAENFLNMVRSGFFSSKVGLFRALNNFLVQFGLAGDPQVQRDYEEKIGHMLPDDPQWLPEGPPGRSIDGIYRFQEGYISYAGGGPNTRSTQLFIANVDSQYLGGGSPWEVPFGQLVSEEDRRVFSKVYTGYGEGPSQGKIRNRGNAYLEDEFPKLDYIHACAIIAENLPWRYERTPVV